MSCKLFYYWMPYLATIPITSICMRSHLLFWRNMLTPTVYFYWRVYSIQCIYETTAPFTQLLEHKSIMLVKYNLLGQELEYSSQDACIVLHHWTFQAVSNLQRSCYQRSFYRYLKSVAWIYHFLAVFSFHPWITILPHQIGAAFKTCTLFYG